MSGTSTALGFGAPLHPRGSAVPRSTNCGRAARRAPRTFRCGSGADDSSVVAPTERCRNGSWLARSRLPGRTLNTLRWRCPRPPTAPECTASPARASSAGGVERHQPGKRWVQRERQVDALLGSGLACDDGTRPASAGFGALFVAAASGSLIQRRPRPTTAVRWTSVTLWVSRVPIPRHLAFDRPQLDGVVGPKNGAKCETRIIEAQDRTREPACPVYAGQAGCPGSPGWTRTNNPPLPDPDSQAVLGNRLLPCAEVCALARNVFRPEPRFQSLAEPSTQIVTTASLVVGFLHPCARSGDSKEAQKCES